MAKIKVLYENDLKPEEEKDLKNIIGLDDRIIEMPDEFYYLTCHREENAADNNILTKIITAMESLDAPTIYPVHSRNRERVKQICEKQQFENIILTHPVGYLTSIALVKGAKKIVTDSGGLQREAFFAGVQCVTVFVCGLA